MTEEKTHVIIAESSPIVSVGLSNILQQLPHSNIHVTELKTPSALMECLKSEHPEILVVNPYFGGYFNISGIRKAYPEIKIVAIETARLDKALREQYNETISIVDDIETISSKIRNLAQMEEAVDGKEPLSTREKEIISLVVKGLTNKEIAEKLFLSIHTVLTHRRNIARKLEIHSATGLTIYAIVNKLVDLSEIKI